MAVTRVIRHSTMFRSNFHSTMGTACNMRSNNQCRSSILLKLRCISTTIRDSSMRRLSKRRIERLSQFGTASNIPGTSKPPVNRYTTRSQQWAIQYVHDNGCSNYLQADVFTSRIRRALLRNMGSIRTRTIDQ